MKQEADMRTIRRRHAIISSRRNKERNYISFPSKHGKTKQDTNVVRVNLPREFSIKNIEESLDFVNTTIALVERHKASFIRFELAHVTQIDMMAICWLISLISKASASKIHCFGNFPDDTEVKDYVQNSGFLDVISSKLQKPSSQKFPNHIYMIGKNTVDSKRLSTLVKSSIEYLTGIPGHYSPVYDNLVEISANSVEHANEYSFDKNWLISVSYERDQVLYILTDVGKGVLSTLKKKKKELFNDIIFFKKDSDVLKGVFEGLYQSQTGEVNRHKGLPEVYESFVDGFISDLQVLTNCVLYNFATQEKKILTNEFKGVMISWTLKKQNIEQWKKSL